MIETEIKDSIDHAREANVLIDLKRYPEALTACSRAIAKEPEEAAHYGTLSQIHLLMSQYDKALEAARRVISLDPQWAFGYYLVSHSLENTNDIDGALRAAKHALSINPEEPALLEQLARMQIETGAVEQAQEIALRLAKMCPEDSATYLLQFDIYMKLEDFASAEIQLRSALRLEPDNPVFHNDLGRIHMANKDWQSAIEAFNNAVKLNPAEKRYQDNLNVAISFFRGHETLRGRGSKVLESLPPEVREFQRYQQETKDRIFNEKMKESRPLLQLIYWSVILFVIYKVLSSLPLFQQPTPPGW